jgi:dTDP-glucose 4,6-dehydratase
LSKLSPNQISILDASIAAVLPHLDLRKLNGQRLFITGGTGFFGLWLLTALRNLNALGIHVEVCVLSRNPEVFVAHNPQFANRPWLNFIAGDVRDFPIPKKEFDLLLHAATETSMVAHADGIKMFNDIFLGTQQVMEFAQTCGVSRMLLISSGAVYGAQPFDLTHQPDASQLACDPLLVSSAYGEGKRAMELLGVLLQKNSSIASVSARCFTFCGPGLPLNAHFAIGNFIHDALFNQHITVQGDGSPIRSYLFSADLAVWLLFLLIEGEAGKSYNVGSEEAISIKGLAMKVRDVLAPHKKVQTLQNQETKTPQSYVPATSRAKALGCQQWTTLEDSLRQTARFVQAGYVS